MAEEKQKKSERREPSGFTPRSGGLSSEYAREQGWDISEEQRAKTPPEKQEYDGGRDYEYGAQDFGDTAVDTSSAQPTGNELGRGNKRGE
jgi:hypothetical protein